MNNTGIPLDDATRPLDAMIGPKMRHLLAGSRTALSEALNATYEEPPPPPEPVYPEPRPVVTLICTPYYADAVRYSDTCIRNGWPEDWRWFASFDVAKDWVKRCNERGTPMLLRWYIQ